MPETISTKCVADFVTHLNGTFTLIGALMSLADDSLGNTFGNGNAQVRYSSSVLLNLPASGNGIKDARILSWSRAQADQGVIP